MLTRASDTSVGETSVKCAQRTDGRTDRGSVASWSRPWSCERADRTVLWLAGWSCYQQLPSSSTRRRRCVLQPLYHGRAGRRRRAIVEETLGGRGGLPSVRPVQYCRDKSFRDLSSYWRPASGSCVTPASCRAVQLVDSTVVVD